MKGNLKTQNNYSKQGAIKELEKQFYENVNQVIATKVTPIYNIILLIWATFFCYFAITEQK